MKTTTLNVVTILRLCVMAALVIGVARAHAAGDAFRPGEVWTDTAGKTINAHGSGMMYHDATYYWYGENKEGRTWLPDANKSWDGYRVDVTGVRCYSSKDLMTWQDEGLVLTAVPDDPLHDLHPSKVLERPKVAFNPRTNKFVMWVHIDSPDYKSARAGVATADSPTGPFVYIESVRPEGGDSRDQTLFVDDDAKAYRVYSAESNDTTYISLLTDDWLKHSGKYVRVFEKRRMEAPVVFKHAGRYYFIASDCTGWDPNPARSAVADSIWGPWTELGNPCTGKEAEITYRGQSTYVVPVAGRPGAFIFMADRWNKQNLPDSRYLWLPLRIRDGKPVVTWEDAWDLTWFDRMAGEARPSPGNTLYHVNAAKGDDANAGTSPEQAWRTIDRANRTAFTAGDKLLLAGGQTYPGTLFIGREVRGTKENPIVISSFGQGRATIDGGKGSGIRLDGCAHVQVRELNLIGCGRHDGNGGDGIEVFGTKGIEVDRVDVSGFRLSGIATRGDADTRITCVEAHDNGFAGISSGSGYGHPRTTNLYVGYCVAHDNPGDPMNMDNHSGNGIVVGQLDDGLVEYCEAYNNGWDMPRKGNGPVGIWGWEAHRLTIQLCISHDNKTANGAADGGGFDFDGGMVDSVLQYNLSYNNQGSGYLLCQYPAPRAGRTTSVATTSASTTR